MAPADGQAAVGRDTAAAASAMACAHCGETANRVVHATVDGVEHAYCCQGCAGAAAWIASEGFGDYYRWRSAPGPRVEAADDYGDWDRAQMLEAHSEAADGGRAIRLALGGMHCAACAWLVDKALRQAPGVLDVRANAVDGRLHLRWDPARTPLSALLQRVGRLGYRPALLASPARDAEQRRERRRQLIALGIAGLGTLQAMMFSEALYLDTAGQMPEATRDAFRWVTAAVSAPVVFIAGAPFLRGMWSEWRMRLPGMDTLIGGGILLAWTGSLFETFRGGPQVWFDAAVMFVLFLLAARFLEARLRDANTARLDAIAGAQPAMAWRLRDEQLEAVPARELAIGDLVQVGTGHALPCDGTVVGDDAWVDEALLTGESTPLRRRHGEAVLAGSHVHAGTLRLQATAVGAATAMSQVARQVAQAREQRPAMAGWAEAIARRVVAATLVLSALVAIAWWFIEPANAFPATLAVLVATCPCALALAVPAAIARAQSRLLARGVLALGPDALPRLASIDRVAFDKTGTLTRGEPQLLDIQPLAGRDAESLRGIAACLELGVAHPLAKAFGEAPADRSASGAVLHPGEGVEGRIDGALWRLGRRRFVDATAGADAADDGGLWLSREGRLEARFDVDDAPRDDAAATVAALARDGMAPRILSGDAGARVAALGERLGIDAAHRQSRLSPEGKLSALRVLQTEGHRVLMVGDGVNDAAVLAAADVSAAMASGASLAQRQADLVLLGSRLTPLRYAMRLAGQTQAIVRQNIVWAIAYNALMLPLAALGIVGPGLAALGMALSSLAVTANAWRIGRGLEGDTP
jgi:Cu2+-exporting ATPase